MNKKILALIIIVTAIVLFFIVRFFILKEKIVVTDNFIKCLADSGMVIYGSKTCPACASLIDNLGGYDKAAPIYVECTIDLEKCNSEMKTNYVPEIQIKGEVYQGSRDIKSFVEISGCQI